MLGAVPLAQQHRSRLETGFGRYLDGPARRGIGCDLGQQSARGRLKPTQRFFLNPIRERADQQVAADAPRRFGAVERPPALLEVGGCGFLQFFDFTDKSRRRCRDFALHVLPALQRGQSHTLLWFACEASQGVHGPIRLPIATSRANDSGKIAGNHSLHAPTRANIPTSPYGSRRFRAKWNPRNWQREASISLSDTPQHRPRRELPGKRLSPHGRSGRRRAASRNRRNWSAAIAGAMIWLRVSSSGGIADAASVSANAMDRRHGRGRRRSRNS